MFIARISRTVSSLSDKNLGVNLILGFSLLAILINQNTNTKFKYELEYNNKQIQKFHSYVDVIYIFFATKMFIFMIILLLKR